MGTFKDRINYKPHNFNTFGVTLNGNYNVTGLNTFSAERNEDEITLAIAADGVGLPQENPNISGTITMEIIQADATNTELWTLWKAGEYIAVAAGDSNDTALKCSMAAGRIKKAPVVTKEGEVQYITWVIEAVYLDLDGGGYSIIAA